MAFPTYSDDGLGSIMANLNVSDHSNMTYSGGSPPRQNSRYGSLDRAHSYRAGATIIANNNNQSLNNSNHRYARNSPTRHSSSRSYTNKSFRKSSDPLGGNSNHSTGSGFQHSYKKPVMPLKQQYIAMDCEMVACGMESVAARVVLIDWKGRVVLDSFLKPEKEITDYRTFVSGITPEQLEDAPAFEQIQQQVQEQLQDKILVGHGVDNDLRALDLSHPWLMTRDTAYYQPFMRLLETSTNRNSTPMSMSQQEPVWGPRKLKDLTKERLNRDIQIPGDSHCPIEDAAAALDLYKSHRPRWEACMSTEEKRQYQQKLQAAAAAHAAYEQQQQQMLCYYGGTDYQQQIGALGLDATQSLHTGYNDVRRHQQQQLLHSRSFHHHTPAANSYSLDAHSYHASSSYTASPMCILGLGGHSFHERLFQQMPPTAEAAVVAPLNRRSSIREQPPTLQRYSSFDSDYHHHHRNINNNSNSTDTNPTTNAASEC